MTRKKYLIWHNAIILNTNIENQQNEPKKINKENYLSIEVQENRHSPESLSRRLTLQQEFPRRVDRRKGALFAKEPQFEVDFLCPYLVARCQTQETPFWPASSKGRRRSSVRRDWNTPVPACETCSAI